MSVDAGARLRDVEWGVALYLVVTDGGVAYRFDVAEVRALVDEHPEWTGADLVRELGPPSVDVDEGQESIELGVLPPDAPMPDLPAMEPAEAGADEAWADGGDEAWADEAEAGAEGGGPSPGAESSPVVTGLQVLVPSVVARNSTVDMELVLTRPGGDRPDLPFEASVGDLLSVVVWPQEGVTVVGEPTATITVAAAAGPSDAAVVQLQITGSRKASVIVEGFRGQTSLGNVLVEMQVVLGGPVAAAAPAAVLPLLPANAPRSDLAIHIVESADATNQRGLRFVAIERDKPPKAFPFQPVTLDPHAVLTPLFDDINAAIEPPKPGQPAAPTMADDIVRAIGLQLSEDLLPAELQTFIGAERQRIKTIVVHTAELSIPWELCLLTAETPAGTEELGYLCELFELTRWRPGPKPKASDVLPMRSIGYVAPGDSGLPSRRDEVTMLEALATGGRVVEEIVATPDGFLDALAGATYDVIHFIGHGALPDPDRAGSAQLRLSGAAYVLAEMLGGRVGDFGRKQPLVFLNACRLGAASAGLVGPAGWAQAVLDEGAAVFIGAHWNVVDATAHVFSAALYERLLAGDTIGAAAKAARLATRVEHDPTWLAYTVYASPTAAVS